MVEDAHLAGGADLDEDGVGDGGAGDVVEVGGGGLWAAAWVDGDEARGLGVGDGDVEDDGGGVVGESAASGDGQGGGRGGVADADVVELSVDGRQPWA